MNEIFTIWIEANFCYDEDGEIIPCYSEEREWVDSYWTDEAAAIAEGERLWNNDSDEMYEKIIVFGRKLNVRGEGKNEWDRERDRQVKCWQ